MTLGAWLFLTSAAIVLLAFGIFDIYAWRTNREFVSYSIYRICKSKPIIPFILGVLTGHFLWQNPPPKYEDADKPKIVQEKHEKEQ